LFDSQLLVVVSKASPKSPKIGENKKKKSARHSAANFQKPEKKI
jgi:hypothetical protein